MARRRIAVEFVAEMLRFHRDMQSGADDVRRLKDESRAAQLEVAKLGTTSQRAAAQVGQAARDAAGQMRNARGQFAAAGSDAGRAFGDGVTRDALGRLRTADGRFASEGRRLGASLGRGVSGGLGGGLGGISGRPLLYLAAGGTAAVAALQGVPPILAAIGGGLGSIPGLAAGASAALATLGVGLSGVGGAIGDIFDPPAGGGGGGGGGIDQTAGALRRLEQAERALRYAQRDARESQVALNRAREQAVRELRDMNLQLRGARLDEKSATLAVLEAERELREIRARGGDPLEIERAQLAYEQAQLTLEETRNGLKDLTIDQGRAAKAGVEGSETVQNALRDQERAYDAVTDAQYGLLDAQEALAAAAAGGGGGAAAQATAYDKLSKNAKKFVDAIRAQKKEIEGLRLTAQDRLFDGLDREFTATFTKTLPLAQKQVIRFGDTWNDTFTGLLRLGRDDQFLSGLDDAFGASDRLFDKINKRIPATGRMLSHLFTGSVPFIDKFGDSLLSYLDDFNAFIDRASRDGSLDDFFRDAAEQADALLDIGKEVIILVGRIGGMDQGSTLLRDMADALEKFNDEAHSMRSVEGIIATGNAAVKGLVDVLLVLGETLGDTLADPGTRDAVVAFFEVLKHGAEIIGTLAQAFALLPDGVQSFLLTGAALAILGSKLFGVLDRVQGAAGRTADRLGQLGPAGQTAGQGLNALSRGANAAAVAFLLWEGSNAIWDQIEKAPADVDRLTKSLTELGNTGRATGEFEAMFSGDGLLGAQGLNDFASSASRADGLLGKFGRTAESIIPFMRGVEEGLTGISWQKAQEDIQAVDQALVQMVQAGDTAGAQATFARLTQASGKSVEEMLRLLPEYRNAIDRVASPTALAAQATDDFAQAQRGAADATRDWLDAELDVEDAMSRASDTITENGEAWNLNTEEGRENRRALHDAARAANEATTAKLRETGSVEEANVVYRENYNRIFNLARQAGATKDEAKKLADQLVKTPDVNVAFETPGLAQSVRLAREYNATLDRIRRNAKAGGFGVNGNFTGVGGNRWGGVYEHAQVGLLRDAHFMSARSPAAYAYAEPGTGGEFFGPKNGNLPRTQRLAEYAIRNWWDGDVAWGGGKAGRAVAPQVITLAPTMIASAAAPSPVVLEIRSSGSSEDELLLERLRRAVRVRGGDVQIVIGTS